VSGHDDAMVGDDRAMAGDDRAALHVDTAAGHDVRSTVALEEQWWRRPRR
jgi:hypothetical protein